MQTNQLAHLTNLPICQFANLPILISLNPPHRYLVHQPTFGNVLWIKFDFAALQVVEVVSVGGDLLDLLVAGVEQGGEDNPQRCVK